MHLKIINKSMYQRKAILLFLFISLLSSCQTETPAAWIPQFLDKEQAPLVDAMATAIIAQAGESTDKIPSINVFIDTTVLKYSGYEQLQFRKGIKLLEAQTKFFTGKSFVDCEKEEQQKCLKLQEREANDNWMSTGEKPFFFIFKELVLAGAAKS